MREPDRNAGTGPVVRRPGPLRVQTGSVPVAARGLPFSIHQVAEYLIGLGLIAQAVQGSKSLLPIALGAAVLLSAALTDGPLAGWKTVSRPAHKVVDIVLAVVALLLPCCRGAGPTPAGGPSSSSPPRSSGC